jgi:hypothetical protein
MREVDLGAEHQHVLFDAAAVDDRHLYAVVCAGQGIRLVSFDVAALSS